MQPIAFIFLKIPILALIIKLALCQKILRYMILRKN